MPSPRRCKDRETFLERLATVVKVGDAELLAWSLLSNHFHLVIRPRKFLLKDLMRRLMTGYVGWYNRRRQGWVAAPARSLWQRGPRVRSPYPVRGNGACGLALPSP